MAQAGAACAKQNPRQSVTFLFHAFSRRKELVGMYNKPFNWNGENFEQALLA